jgi:hypothetical protein
MQGKSFKQPVHFVALILWPALILIGLVILTGQVEAQEGSPVRVNLVQNGDFEYGFYQVPQLGFEPPDVGNVPIGWNWYKNQAYGKYTINSSQRFGLACPSDLFGPPPPQVEEASPFAPVPGAVAQPTFNALVLHMQSTDQMDARLGVYQTVNVVPGQTYRFTMDAVILVQPGARIDEPNAQNHTFELFFDQAGGTDWTEIPFEQWTNVALREQRLVFDVEEAKEDDGKGIADIQRYTTTVTAASNQMTIFITGWRKWANFRSVIFAIDCVSLEPLSSAGVPASSQPAAAAPPPAAAPTNDVQPVAITEPGESQAEEAAPPQAPEIIPPSGGVLEENGNTILVIVASALVILGLVGAGVWNMRR